MGLNPITDAYNYYNDARNLYGNLRGSMPPMFSRSKGGYKGRTSKTRRRPVKWNSRSIATQKRFNVPRTLDITQKYVDEFFTATDCSRSVPLSTGVVGTVATSTNEGGRIGNTVRVLGYKLTVVLTTGSETTTGAHNATYRIFMVRDKLSTSTTDPALTSWFDPDGGGYTSTQSFRNIEKIENSEVLLDRLVTIIPPHNSSNSGIQCYNFNVSCGFIQRYTGTAASTLNKNGVFCYVLGTNFNSAASAPAKVNIRTVYSDV